MLYKRSKRAFKNNNQQEKPKQSKNKKKSHNYHRYLSS